MNTKRAFATPRVILAALALSGTPPSSVWGDTALYNTTGQYVWVDRAVAPDLRNRSFTIEFWARRTAFNGNHFVIGQGSAANHRYLHIGFRADNTFAFAFYGNDLNLPRPVIDSAWHHYACVYDVANGLRQVFVDGALAGSDTASAPLQDVGHFFIGQAFGEIPRQAQLNFNGLLDEVRVWSVARTAAEIRDHRHRLLSGSETGLEAYYPFEDAGDGTADVTGHGRQGVVVGSQRVAAGAPFAYELASTTPPDVTGDGILLNGLVHPGPGATTTWFEWGAETRAIFLDGGSQHGDLPDGDFWFPGSALTIEAWVYPRAHHQWSRLVDFGNGPGADNVLFALSNGTSGRPHYQVWRGAQVQGDLLAPAALPLHRWTHLAVSHQGTQATLYVNGQPVRTVNMSQPTRLRRTENFVGRSNWAADGYANASLDELRIWSAPRTAEQIRTNLYRSLAPSDRLGLLAYYPFDEPEGAVALDASGRNRPLTLLGAPPRPTVARPHFTATTPTRAVGTASEVMLGFDGVDDRVEIPHDATQNTLPLTTTAWVRCTSATTGGVVNKYLSGSLNGWQIYLLNGEVRAWYFRNAQNYVWDRAQGLNAGPVDDGQWHHLAFAVDDAGGRLYVDGVLRDQRAWTGVPGTPTTTLPVKLGAYDAGIFRGELRDATLWKVALDDTEIRDLARQPFTTAHPKFPQVLGWWRLNEGSGSMARNSKPGGLAGTLLGDPGWLALAPASEALPDPTPGATHHYRLVTRTSAGVTPGESHTLSLPATPAGNALDFDGVDDRMSVRGWNSLGVLNEVTIELWQRAGSLRNASTFAFLPDVPGSNRLQAHIPWGNGRVYWDFGNAPAGRLDYLPPVSLLNDWHHFAFVAKAGPGGYLRLYRNGVLEAERTGTIPTFNAGAADELRLGQLQDANGVYAFDGTVDDVRVWTIARSATDIARDYNRRLTGAEPGLAAFYRLDELTGTVVSNASAGRFQGALLNGTHRWVSTAPVEASLPLDSFVAENVASGAPRLVGQVKPGGSNPHAWFEYGDRVSIDSTNAQNLARFWVLPQNVDVSSLAQVNFAAAPNLTTNFTDIYRPATTGNFQPGIVNDRFAASFRGRLYVPQPGTWTFFLASDDGSQLFLDGKLVVDHDGLHGTTERSGTVPGLSGGLHDVEVRMFENLGSASLMFSWSGPGTPYEPVPADAFRTVPIFDRQTPVQMLSGNDLVPVTAVVGDVPPGVSINYRLVAADDLTTHAAPGRMFAVPYPAAGYALTFDGINDQLIGTVDTPETEATHELWFRTTTPNGGLFSIVDSTGNFSGHDRHIYLKNGNIAARLWSNETIQSTNLNLADGQWHHVAHSFGASLGGQILVVDGVEVARGVKTNSTFTAGKVIRIGLSQDATPPWFRGELDEIRLWRRALTAEEIRARYTQPLTGNEPDLLAWYRLDDIQNQTTSSEVGSGNSLTLSPADPLQAPVLGLSRARIFKPSATTLPAAPVLATSATLLGEVNPSGQPNTSAFFEWGTALTFPTQTTSLNVGGAVTNVLVAITLTGLEPGTTYRYRVVAENASGRTVGEIRTFDTLLLGCGWPLASKVSNGGAQGPRQAMDADGNVILAGSFSGVLTFKSSISTVGAAQNPFVAKANKKGDWLWQVGVPVTGSAQIHAAGTDAAGNVVVAGQFTGEATFDATRLTAPAGATQFFVAQLAADGSAWRWARSAAAGTDHTVTTLAVAGDGSAVVAGTFAGSLTLGRTTLTATGVRDVFAARLAADGANWLWAVRAGGTTATLRASSLVEHGGVLYLAGDFSHTAGQKVSFATAPQATTLASAGGTDLFFAKLATNDGRWLFARRAGGAEADTAFTLTKDSTGAPFLAARLRGAGPADYEGIALRGTVGSDNTFVARFTTNGVLSAIARCAPVDVSAMVLDSNETVWITGDFTVGPVFGTLPGLTSRGESDVYVARLDARDLDDNRWLWAISIGGLGLDTRGGLGLDPKGNLFVSGTYQGEVKFGFAALAASNPQSDVFLAKINTERLKYEYNTYVIGAPVEIPAEAVDPNARGGAFAQPTIEILEQDHADSEPANSFVWSIAEKKLFAVRPVTARFRWPLSANPSPLGGSSVVCVGRSTWPEVDHPRQPASTDNDKRARLHIAQAPANLEPAVEGRLWTYHALSFTDIHGAAVDGTTRQFNAPSPGWTVLQFLQSAGAEADPTRHPSLFEVVRTERFDDARYLTAESVPVSQTLRRNAHQDPEGRQGYVLNELSFYDGAGEDRAHDRPTRAGPIIPVNVDRVGTHDDLVVVWYRRSPDTGIAWPQDPVRYTVTWPTTAPRLIVASGRGFTLTAEHETAARIYNQPDPRLAGFNPNEEHAFLDGRRLFALRDDLHALLGASEPFVLLKYRQPGSGEWTMQPLQVVAEGTLPGETFERDAIAGQLLGLIEPLGLPAAFTTGNYCDPSPHWLKDYEGRLYARAAGPGESQARIAARFFYKMQPGFFYDLNGDGAPDVPIGAPLPLLDRRRGGQPGVPTPVTYHVAWPTDVKDLWIGDTLFGARAGLPDLTGWSSADFVFDQSDPEGTNALAGLARLFDPLSARTIQVRPPGATNFLTGPGYDVFFAPDDFDPVDGIGTVRTPDGKQQLVKLPFSIRVRLLWDEGQRNLIWRGHLDEAQDYGGRENPLLLINVMSERERQTIQAQDEGVDSPFDRLVAALYDLCRNPNRLDLDGQDGPDRDLLIGLRLGPVTNIVNGVPVVTTRVLTETLSDQRKALTACLGNGGTGYLTLAENNDPALNGTQPIRLHVLRIRGGPFPGDIKVIRSDNVFDEKLVLRHSSDFAAQPERFEFEWYYQPDTGPEIATDLPIETANGTDLKGWRRLQAGDGINDVVLGDPSLAGDPLLVLSDNWVICRYRGYAIGGATNWSDWVGLIGGQRAQFAPGWVKRVRDGLNPFTARSQDFHNAPTATYASMLQQAGRRYEGDIAFNGSPENLNRIGLIEAYETVLRRGRQLSIDAAQPVDDPTANNALLLAAGSIADLYMLLGNEAFADAADPTIGFRTDAAGYGTLAPCIFTFQNQLDSLLEEELALLRGKDDTGQSVRVPPAYNRLFWNFTKGEGEVAYAQTYNLTDLDGSGEIDTTDAQSMFPQGHGDAWGHYLTALTTYYGLLRSESFTWIPRAETVNLGGNAVTVDYLDERKFATAAAAKARTGAEIVDLTYRRHYVDDPRGQWQGYKDTHPDRAWGVTEWARRAGVGAYYDWVVANAILPSQDPNPEHTGLAKIDRQTVTELNEILAAAAAVQGQLDKADAGLNPVGLAKNAVPFDIDPTEIATGKTHFEQIYDRAFEAVQNALTVFNHANQLTQSLRALQDNVNQFTRNVEQEERSYKNRLIEIFGYPYGGDIGPGRTYPSEYDGPDLYHWMYVPVADVIGEAAEPTEAFTGYFTRLDSLTAGGGHYFEGDLRGALSPELTPEGILSVRYPVLPKSQYPTAAPAAWGSRRAPGEIQLALSDLLQARARLEKALLNYDNLLARIDLAIDTLDARTQMGADAVQILSERNNTVRPLKVAAFAAGQAKNKFKGIMESVEQTVQAVVEGVPKSVGLATDAFASVRAVLLNGRIISTAAIKTGYYVSVAVEEGSKFAIEEAQQSATSRIEANRDSYEIAQLLRQVETLLHEEAPLRAEAETLAEGLRQQTGRYQAAVERGYRLLEERAAFRRNAAGDTQARRYQDMTFRVFRNDALQKYRAQFDLAARYTFLAAVAYDFETQLLGGTSGAGREFLTDIIRQRSLGQIEAGHPIAGRHGLADPLARLRQNFSVLKGQLGFSNPQTETGRFSLRSELFRIHPSATGDDAWRATLRRRVMANLWDLAEFRRYCRPFAPESAGPQPGLVLRFPTTVTFGLNYFGWPLGGGDSAYDPTLFATKIRSVGVWFSNYDGNGLSQTPRVYLVPAGADVLRTPGGNDLNLRFWRVLDQRLPVPFPIGYGNLADPAWIPVNDSLSGTLEEPRRFSSFRAYHDSGTFNVAETISDSRLIGRSVWNTDWLLIVPGGTFLSDPQRGLEGFIQSVRDIKIFFQTYSYSGN